MLIPLVAETDEGDGAGVEWPCDVRSAKACFKSPAHLFPMSDSVRRCSKYGALKIQSERMPSSKHENDEDRPWGQKEDSNNGSRTTRTRRKAVGLSYWNEVPACCLIALAHATCIVQKEFCHIKTLSNSSQFKLR